MGRPATPLVSEVPFTLQICPHSNAETHGIILLVNQHTRVAPVAAR